MSEPTTAVAQELLAWLRKERTFWAETADEDEQHTHIRQAAIARRDQLDMLLQRLPRDLARIEDEAVENDRAEEQRMLDLVGAA